MLLRNLDNLPRQREKEEQKAYKKNSGDLTGMVMSVMTSVGDLTEMVSALTEAQSGSSASDSVTAN